MWVAMVRIKVVFPIAKDEDGYPPVEYESLWALKIRGSTYKVDNIPFFTYSACVGDEIVAIKKGDEYWFERNVKPSGNSLIRIIYYKEADHKSVRDDLSTIGCDSEELGEFRIIAVNVPNSRALVEAREILDRLEMQELISYEEAVVRQ